MKTTRAWLLVLLSATLARPGLAAAAERVASVRIEGAAPAIALETKAGANLDPAAVRRDVRRLWRLGAFSNVQVRREPMPQGAELIFELAPRPRFALRRVRFEPPSAKRDLQSAPPPWIDQQAAGAMARELGASLRRQGYADAHVRGVVEPVGPAEADIVLFVETGERVRVKRIEVTGLDPKQAKRLRRKASELSPRTLIPGLFRSSRALNADRLTQDVRSLQAELVSQGRLAASIHAEAKPDAKQGRFVTVRFAVSPGPVFAVQRAEVRHPSPAAINVEDGRFPADALCHELRIARREAETQGRLGFAASIEALSAGADADSGARPVVLSASTSSDAPATVRRIDFSGATSLRESTLRRALRLEEGALLDLGLLRRDLTRLSRFEALQPVRLDDVEITPLGDGRADVLIPVQGRKSRRWSISGPLGPASLFGPFQGLIETRLPPWGRGLLEASTYSAGFWLAGLPRAVVVAEGWRWKTFYEPAFVVRRTLLPGRPWASGWMWSPQSSSRANAATNIGARSRGLLSKAVSGRAPQPPLVVPVIGEGVYSELVCRDPKSWFDPLRGAARFLTGI